MITVVTDTDKNYGRLRKRSINVFWLVCFILESVWNVWVWTSDMRGAGTDANVYLTLYGDKGKTDEVPIGNATDNFEQGQLDKFKVSFFLASVRNIICNYALLVSQNLGNEWFSEIMYLSFFLLTVAFGQSFFGQAT